ncbi:uncharacterized protein LOC124178259 [Neodiprion fabricii]|uniref:uncharacterized protein LOC124178259 n=1 Tax=Neodiprion fabricii TaxID=2872261 RepID=UPI001ED983F1|nr:uncharacterized protein LOC124178259 [Neodiprion fabricii]
MAAAVYLRSTSADGTTTVTLVCSKTKVAPLKRLTIPKLELSAALLLAKLMSSVQRALELSEGTLRAGRRLKHSLLQPEAKHPPILPRTLRLTALVISDAHSRTLHGGTQSTLSYLRQSYWILGGRAPVRAHILQCITCLFTIKTWRRRAAKTYKGYLAVFVCFGTSAVHFELVTDYTSEAFIAAYRRFSGRRGICHTLYSDCGTKFIRADAELRALFRAGSAEMNSTITSLTNLGTTWSFNPPAAPHMGGKWEAAV